MVRLIRPAPSVLLQASQRVGEPSLDLEAQLRRAVVEAISDLGAQTLADDTLEAIACTTSEIIDDICAPGVDSSERTETINGALSDIFEEARISEELKQRIVHKLLAVACSTPAIEITVPHVGQETSSARREGDDNQAQKYRRRGDVERERAAAYLEEHDKQLELEKNAAERKERELAEFFHIPCIQNQEPEDLRSAPGAFNPVAAAALESGAVSPSTSDSEKEEDESTIRDREATKKRLRKLGQPATFFGETDEARTARLNQLELNREQDEIATGSTNVLQLVTRRAQLGVNVDRDDEDFHVTDMRTTKKFVVPLPTTSVELVAESSLQLSTGRHELTLEEEDDDEDGTDEAAKCVAVWIRNTLREWERELTTRASTDKGRGLIEERGQYRQTKQYLRPLRKALQDASINPSIIWGIKSITDACEKRCYKEAKEAYMRLAIGNQAWPMGVTTVTFHDRPNRHNIGEDNVAHILNDETTRKYVQMIKRLSTYAETRWPADPSRAA